MGNIIRRIFRLDNNNNGPPVIPSVPEDPNKPRSIKIVLLGASNVGKTCLIVNYNTGSFNEDRVPNVLDIFKGQREFDGRPLNIEIVDTSGDTNLGAHR